MRRRTLLQSCSALSLGSLAGQLWATPAHDTRLLLVGRLSE